MGIACRHTGNENSYADEAAGPDTETLREHINSLTDNDVWCVFKDALGDAPIDCGSLAKLLDQLLEEHEAWDGFNSYLFKATCAEFMANVLKTMSQQTGFRL